MGPGTVSSTRRPDGTVARAAVEPIKNAGKLGVVLAQFPPSFKNQEATRGYLEWLVPSLTECSVAVELRHRS